MRPPSASGAPGKAPARTGIGRRQALKALGAAGLALGGVRPRAAPAADVLVLGAGLAGLAAARRLAEAGMRPLVLEARDRPGGRLFTRFDLPDRAELGAVEVGDSYTRVHALARACGLSIQAHAPGPSPGLTLHVNGHTLNAADWADSPANTLPGPERNVLPGRLEAHYLARDIPLARASDWDRPASHPHDRSITTVLRERGISAEALRLVNVAGNHDHSDAASALGWWRGALARRADTGSGRFAEGAGALATRLAAPLGDAVRYGNPVTEIAQDGLPPAMWTDTPLERIFPRHDPATGACIGFKAFVNGAGAAALDRLGETEFEALARATLARVRPSTAGRVRHLGRHGWGADPFAGGAYAAWPPGKVAAWRAAARKPAGRVRFAGEHTADAPGMEGAVRSGERAAAAILDALS